MNICRGCLTWPWVRFPLENAVAGIRSAGFTRTAFAARPVDVAPGLDGRGISRLGGRYLVVCGIQDDWYCRVLNDACDVRDTGSTSS